MSVTVSDNMVADGVASDGAGCLTPMQSEILCFISGKSLMMPLDDIVKLCVDFYREDEVMKAHSLLLAGGHKLYKRKGADKVKNTVEDIVKLLKSVAQEAPSV